MASATDAPLPDPIIVHSDMPEDWRKVCFAAAAAALIKFKVEKDQAAHVKRTLEAWNGALWHVVIGTGFGASVAHENRGLLLFRIGRVHILCFQSFDDGSLINSHLPKAEHVSRVVQDGKESKEDEE